MNSNALVDLLVNMPSHTPRLFQKTLTTTVKHCGTTL